MKYLPLSELLTIQKGKKPVRISNIPIPGYEPYIDIKAFEHHAADKYTDGEHAVSCGDGDLLLVWDGSRTGLVGRAQKGYVGSTLAKLSARGVRNDFLYYFLVSNYELLNATAKGTTGISHINPQVLGNLRLPILSESEQTQVVARIEALVGETEAAVGALNHVRQKLNAYRHAVLSEAFRDFTEKAPIGRLSSLVTSGSRGWAKYYSFNGDPFIRIGNLTRTGITINLNHVQNVEPPKKSEGKRSLLEPGDVLVSITADLGCIGLVPENLGRAYINQHIAMIRFHNKKQAPFYAWYLRSAYGQTDLCQNQRGGSKPGLGLDDVRSCPVPVVSDGNAERVCRELSARLSSCEETEAAVVRAISQAARLKQGILEKAFKG